MKKIFLLARTDIKRTIRMPKLWLLLVFTIMFFYDFAEQSVLPFAKELNVGVAPYMYTLFYTDGSGLMYGLMLMVALMSDAPFKNGSEIYIRLRTSGYSRMIGKLLYMAAAALIYHAFSIVIAVAVCLPYVGFSLDWGDAIMGYVNMLPGSVTMDGINEGSGILSYNPMEAMVYQYIIAVLTTIMLGLVIFTLNSIFKNYIGTVVVCIFSCVHTFINAFNSYGLLRGISSKLPMTWLNLAEFSENMTPLSAIIIILIICMSVFMVDMILVKAKRLEVV